MKNIFCFVTIALHCMLAMSCSSDEYKYNDEKLTATEFVTAVESSFEVVSVDNATKTIKVKIPTNVDKSAVKLKLKLAKDVSMLSPKDEESTYDLTDGKGYFALRVGSYEINFKIEVIDVFVPIDPTTKGWTKVTDMGALPANIEVYKSLRELNNKNVIAYVAIADTKQDANFHVLGEATSYKTPTQFYESTSGEYPIIINGGYFWDNRSLSMIWRDGQMISPNLRSEGRSDGKNYYFTRGVFSQSLDNVYSATWTYTTFGDETYYYPAPLPNSGKEPLPQPSITYPSGAKTFEAKRAIGGGPVLVKGGKYIDTAQAEMFDAESGVGPTINNPRTAIGVTGEGKIVLFVCEGRNKTPNVPGLTAKEVADLMLDLGCTEVLNLDGGGSSCMLVNGHETIIPTDANGQRRVASAVALK